MRAFLVNKDRHIRRSRSSGLIRFAHRLYPLFRDFLATLCVRSFPRNATILRLHINIHPSTRVRSIQRLLRPLRI